MGMFFREVVPGRRTQTLLSALSFVGGALLILFFIAKYPKKKNSSDYQAFVRRRAVLKDALDNVRVKRSILEGRVSDHFLFFCIQGPISAEVSAQCFSHANNNVSKKNEGIYLMVCRCSCVLIASIIFVLTMFKCFTELNIGNSGRVGTSNTVLYCALALFFMVTAIGIRLMALVQKGHEAASRKQLYKLSNVLEKENRKYNRMFRSIEVYNALSEQVKYDIRMSESFSVLVRDKILSGSLTEECANKIAKEVTLASVNQEQAALG